jgi:signal transduction histidine kinase
LLGHELDGAKIEVRTALASKLPLLPLDQEKIEQVFISLFLNAIQAMASGGTLSITARLKQLEPGECQYDPGSRSGQRFHAGETVVAIDIEDTGSGIAPEIAARVFDPFFTTKDTGAGTGLGLTVSRSVIELHGGSLTLHTREPHGVCVTLLLKCPVKAAG